MGKPHSTTSQVVSVQPEFHFANAQGNEIPQKDSAGGISGAGDLCWSCPSSHCGTTWACSVPTSLLTQVCVILCRQIKLRSGESLQYVPVLPLLGSPTPAGPDLTPCHFATLSPHFHHTYLLRQVCLPLASASMKALEESAPRRCTITECFTVVV